MRNEFADLHVMAVHDNRHVLHIMKVVLTALGVGDVRSVTTLNDALAIGGRAQPDVIITDIVLERGEFFDAVRALRNPQMSFNPYVPIVVASGHTQLSKVRGAINAGAHEFVSFPLSPRSIAKRLYSAVFMGRPFVTTPTFFGPDRRRYIDLKRSGPERRVGLDTMAAQARFAARARVEDQFGDQVSGGDVLIP